jgi:hypothetical protein
MEILDKIQSRFEVAITDMPTELDKNSYSMSISPLLLPDRFAKALPYLFSSDCLNRSASPQLEPHHHHQYAMSVTLTIHCAILGEKGIFEVKIDSNSSVLKLKNAVKAENSQTLQRVAATLSQMIFDSWPLLARNSNLTLLLN